MTAGAWWDAFSEAGGLPDLETWLGGVDAASRVRVRQRIAECRYENALDCGAGLGLDWFGSVNYSHPFVYSGIEPSEKMREATKKASVAYGREENEFFPIAEGSIEWIPYPDSSFDLVYCRHVLEHLPRFEVGLSEMIRVATLEVIAVFFMRPGKEAYLYRERDGLWQNRYAKEDIEAALLQDEKAEVWFWETLGSEVLLHVYLNHSTTVDPTKVAERMNV